MERLIEAAVMALAALEEINKLSISPGGIALPGEIDTAMDMLRAAIVPSDCSDSHQPVAWMVYTLDGRSAFVTDNPKDFTQDHRALPLYTSPPQRKPLTDEDLIECERLIDVVGGMALKEPVLQDIEQYRLQMAGISTAAIGYWKEGDGIHPDYDTIALRDVAKLYAKYDALYKAQDVSHGIGGEE